MDYGRLEKAELSEGKEAVIPIAGETVVLYLCPHNRDRCWECDIGSLCAEGDVFPESDEADALIWESAFGIRNGFDGLKIVSIAFAGADNTPRIEAGDSH